MSRCSSSLSCTSKVFVFVAFVTRGMVQCFRRYIMHQTIIAKNPHTIKKVCTVGSSPVFRTTQERAVGAELLSDSYVSCSPFLIMCTAVSVEVYSLRKTLGPAQLRRILCVTSGEVSIVVLQILSEYETVERRTNHDLFVCFMIGQNFYSHTRWI